MKRTRKGFTLIELLIVIAILGALTAMMQLSSTNATAAAKAASVVNGLRTIRTAASMYIAENSASALDFDKFKTGYKGYLDSSYTKSAQFDVDKSDDGSTWYAVYNYETSDTDDFKEKVKSDSYGTEEFNGTDSKPKGVRLTVYTSTATDDDDDDDDGNP